MSTPYPPAPGGQYPQPAVPAKKRKWPWVAGVVVFLIAVSSFSGGDKKEPENDARPAPTAVAQAPAPAPEPEPVAATMNTPVRDGKFEFVVKAVQPGLAEVGDNPYLIEKAQGQFVIVTLSVANIGDQAQGFSPSNQKLFDTEGRSFESDSMAQIALGSSDIPVWDNINPGNTVDVSLVYDMPAAATPASIELHDSMFSGGVMVNLTP
ncbi:DUF4352 domain-containing protein [Mycolicibacterium sp. XJ870]